MTALSKYLSEPCGRLFAGTIGLALIGAGAVAMAGPLPTSSIAVPLLTMVLVMCSIISIGLSLGRHPTIALVLILAVPPVGGFYFAGVATLGPVAGVWAGVLLLACSAIPLYAAIRPQIVVRGSAQEPAHSHAYSR
jgi:hypothetical protein